MKTLLHLELTNICTLKCPGCHRTQRIAEGENWRNHSLSLNALKRFIDVDLQDRIVVLCGNYGDPIYHPEFYGVIQWLKHKGASIRLITNGGHKTAAFWRNVASLLTSTDEVVFSIDGTPENFTEYRINGDWDSTLVGIQTVASSQAKLTWKYIVFNYNENDIEQTRKYALSIGVDTFETHSSNRYTDEFNKKYLPSEQYVDTSAISARKKVLSNEDTEFTPKCAGDNPQFNYYIDATGSFVPCCLLADRRFYYSSGFFLNDYNIANTTLSETLAKLKGFYEFKNPLDGCRFFCGR